MAKHSLTGEAWAIHQFEKTVNEKGEHFKQLLKRHYLPLDYDFPIQKFPWQIFILGLLIGFFVAWTIYRSSLLPPLDPGEISRF